MKSAGQLEQRLLVLVTLGLVAFGLVMVFSATSASAALGAGDPMTFLVKQGAYALAGLLLLALASRFDYHRFRALAPILLVGALVLCVAVLVVAPSINGAHRWFLVGPISVQPSEVAKIASLHLGVCAPRAAPDAADDGRADEAARPRRRPVLRPDPARARPRHDDHSRDHGGRHPARLRGAVSTPRARRIDHRSCSAPRPSRWSPTVARASSRFIDPWQDPQGAGFQTVQAIIGMGSGGITGEGLGHGVSKVFYLPEAHTDMIFAIVGEELGLIGSTVGDRRLRGVRVGRLPDRASLPRSVRQEARRGLTTLVCGQAAVNLCAVLGIAPLTGIPLPFVSYGGSSLIVLLAAVGVLLNIAVNDRVVEARSRDRGGRDRRSHQARARGRGGAARPRSDRDVRRAVPTASSRSWFLRQASSSTRSRSAASRGRRRSHSSARSGAQARHRSRAVRS